METIIFSVEGMSCNHCVQKIEGALNELEGVCHSKVKLSENTVEVMYEADKIETSFLIDTISEQGYEVMD